MAQDRRAEAWWQGDLQSGNGEVTAATTKVFSSLPITWKARTEEAGGVTSPEELLATAHAACFSMASSNNLAKAGFPPDRMDVTVDITADRRDAGWTVVASHITVRGKVPGIDEAAFQEAVAGAKDGCPISRAMKGNVEITLEATLVA